MQNITAENINSLKEELNEEELSLIAEEYPYYPLAQFRLLSAFKKNQHKNFEKQALKTSLFFNSTRWLNKQLSDKTKTDVNDNVREEQTENLTAIVSEEPKPEIQEPVTDQLSENVREVLAEKDTNELPN